VAANRRKDEMTMPSMLYWVEINADTDDRDFYGPFPTFAEAVPYADEQGIRMSIYSVDVDALPADDNA
jgi:hypothetical protein